MRPAKPSGLAGPPHLLWHLDTRSHLQNAAPNIPLLEVAHSTPPCAQECASNIPLPASHRSQPSHAILSPNFEANYGSETSTVPRCTIPIRLCLKPINHHCKFSISEQVSMGQLLSCQGSSELGTSRAAKAWGCPCLGETLLTPPHHLGVPSQP